MPTVAMIQHTLKEWSRVRQSLEATLQEALSQHDMQAYLARFEADVLSHPDLASAYFDFLRNLKNFISSPDRHSADALRDYQASDMLRFGSAYFFFTMRKTIRSHTRLNGRLQRSGKTQCSETIDYMQAGVLLDRAFGKTLAVRCTNWGAHFIRSKAIDGSFVYLWTRLGTNWGYIGDQRVRIDFLNECIDFEHLEYFYSVKHFVQELWWTFYVATSNYVTHLDIEQMRAVDAGRATQKFAFFSEGFWHIGHEIWNSFSAADFFVQNGVRFDIVLGYEHRCLHGDLERILSDVAAEFVLVDSVDALARYLAQSPEVVTFMTRHDFIGRNLSKQVLDNLRIDNHAMIDRVIADPAALSICFGIRCGNRECLNAFDLLESLIDTATRHLNGGLLRIVLDGTQRQKQTGTHAAIATDVEAQLLERMHRELGTRENVELIDTAHLTYPESVRLVNLCDIFVTPWGAGLAKTCWVGRLPGVIYGNRFILGRNGDYDLYSSGFWVEEPNRIEYLPADHITRDVERSPDGKINDFEIDPARFSAFVWSFIESAEIKRAWEQMSS
ncbi:hypothetical protein BJF92_07285 [Rhizobium rhizosphaerae]|uniref:Uncharacterized protein n=1 Tax=Xaviernesmea rhizosphaerae TaxID=1672749 RepID=A0A1Q9ACZ7_9HYPH|nr:hypothetical protein [Xaviernesmea rhizosphaerae]OLP52782.1 hypothetical protein BJF92_07285 [Xaviernesmea rhizosphaerae]